jgi:hypothetical protein
MRKGKDCCVLGICCCDPPYAFFQNAVDSMFLNTGYCRLRFTGFACCSSFIAGGSLTGAILATTTTHIQTIRQLLKGKKKDEMVRTEWWSE